MNFTDTSSLAFLACDMISCGGGGHTHDPLARVGLSHSKVLNDQVVLRVTSLDITSAIL